MLSWIAVQNEVDRIEHDLEERSRHALAGAGLDWASIAFSGRDGVLVGTARKPDERAAAVALVQGVWGVRTVEDRTQVAAMPQVAAAGVRAADDPKPRRPQVAPVGRADSLPRAVALPARTFTASESGGWVPGEAERVPAKEPELAVLQRPRPVAVITREIADQPAPASGARSADVPAIAQAALPAPAVTRESAGAAKSSSDALAMAAPPQPATVITRESTAAPAAAAKPAAAVPPVADAPRPLTVVTRASPKATSAPEKPSAALTGAPLQQAVPAAKQAPALVPAPARKGATGPAQPMVVGRERANVPSPVPKATVGPRRAQGGGQPPMVTAAVGEAGGSAPDTECRATVQSIAMSGEIQFGTGNTSLDHRGRALLDRLVQVVQACPRLNLDIAGHADSRGPARRNLKLSQCRARAAKRYLVNKGVDAGRLKAVGYGETRPLVPNDTAENRAKNRRIEVEARDLASDPEVSPSANR